MLGGVVDFMIVNAPGLTAAYCVGEVACAGNHRTATAGGFSRCPDDARSGHAAVRLRQLLWGVRASGTPPDVVRKLNAAFNQVAAMPEVAAQFRNLGAAATQKTPDEASRQYRNDIARMKDVVRRPGFRSSIDAVRSTLVAARGHARPPPSRIVAMPRYESPYDPASTPKNLEHVIYEKKGHVAYVTINRPDVRNALHSYAYMELRSCWRDIGLDPNIYVGIVTGTGDAFCAGRDVKFLAQAPGRGQAHAARGPEQPDLPLGRRRPAAAT